MVSLVTIGEGKEEGQVLDLHGCEVGGEGGEVVVEVVVGGICLV